MAPASKKQKWRRVDLSETQQFLDDQTLHQKIESLDTQGNLFALDTQGCDPLENLSHRARRVFEGKFQEKNEDKLQSHRHKSATTPQGRSPRTNAASPAFSHLPREDESSTSSSFSSSASSAHQASAFFPPAKLRDSSCLASKKPSLLQVVSKHHKKHILRAVKQRKQENGDESSFSSLSAAKALRQTSKSSASRFFNQDLIDIWQDETKEDLLDRLKKGNSKVPAEREEKLQVRQKGQIPEEGLMSSSSSSVSCGVDDSQQPGSRASSSTSKRGREKVDSSSESLSPASDEAGAESRTTGTPEEPSKKKKREGASDCSSSSSSSSSISMPRSQTSSPEEQEDSNSEERRGGGEEEAQTSNALARLHERDISKTKKKKKGSRFPCLSASNAVVLTSRKLKSFDRLRAFVPALPLPKNDESYNPSARDHERALLISAVCTLEEQEALQKSQAARHQILHSLSKRSLHSSDLTELGEFLLQKKNDQDLEKGHFSRYARPVNAALAEIGVAPDTVLRLSDTQKQKLLYELVHGGKEIKVDKDGRPRLVSSENAEEEGYLIEDLEDEEGASSASDEEDKDKEGEDGEERNERECEEETRRGSLFDRTLKNRKKTRQDRNRRLRFLQQQRRRGAKVSSKAFRRAIDNVSSLIKDLEIDEKEKLLLRQAKRERLEAKIQAAKEGFVKLKIGRNRFIEPPPLAPLPEDLGGSLRTMKALPGGGAVASQMASLQRRGLIELPPTGGASGVYLRRIQKARSRKLRSRKRLIKK